MATDIQIQDRYKKLQRLRELKKLRDQKTEARSNFVYEYTPPANGSKEEVIYNERNSVVFKTPVGSGRLMRDIIENEDFNPPPSTTFEQIDANAQKMSANLFFLLAAKDIIPDDVAAKYISERSKAWQNVQARQPETTKAFFDKWNSSGVFGKTAAVFQYPQAVGREIISQAPNAVLPLFAGFVGAKGGAAIGAPTGAAVGSIVPGAGTVAGSAAGAVIGGAAGSLTAGYQANKIMGAAETLDEIAVREYGVNPADAESVLEFLTNPDKVASAQKRAVAAGADMAAVETITQIMTLGIAKWTKGMKLSGRLAGAGSSVALEAGGETGGEAARQYSAFKDVDWNEALFEGVASLGQSAGTTAINYGIVGTQATAQQAKSVVFKIKQEKQQQRVEIAQATDLKTAERFVDKIDVQPDTQDEAEVKARAESKMEVVDLILEAKQKSPEALGAILQKEHKKIDALKTELLNIRIKDLEKESSSLKKQIEKTEDKGALSVLNKELNKVGRELDRLIVDREEMVQGKKVESAAKVIQRQKQNIKKIVSSFKEGARTAKQDVKAIQSAMIEVINDAGFDAASKAKFLYDIKNLKKPKDLALKIANIADQNIRKQAVQSINETLLKAKKTRVVAADFVKAIEEVASAIDTKKRQEGTIKRLQATREFMSRFPDAELPTSILKQLEILERTPIDQVKTDDLVSISEKLNKLYEQGRTKQKLKERARIRRQEKRIAAIQQQEGTVAFNFKEEAVEGLDRPLSGQEKMQNWFTRLRNRAHEIGVTTNVADIFFNMFDGGKNYKGAVYSTFKKPIDAAYNRYLDYRKSVQSSVKELAKELNLKPFNYKRIGVYATLQQDGGKEKLMSMGMKESDLDGLSLDQNETKMYEAMRSELDKIYPRLSEVMVDVYNEDVGFVKNYFPFITDINSMTGMEVKEMFGDAPKYTTKKKNVSKKFTIERTGGRQKLQLNAFDVFMHHTDNAAYLIEMGQTTKELQETATSSRSEVLLGDMGQELISDWLDLIARKGRHPTADRGMDEMRGNVGSAVLGFKIGTVLVQSTALVYGMAHIGPGYVSRGIYTFTESDNARKFIFDNMPEVRERMGDDPAYLNFGDSGPMLRKWRQMGYTPMQVVDSWIASAFAIGAYMKAVEKKGGVVDFNNPDQDAIIEAQLMTRRANSSPFTKDAALVASLGKLTGDKWSQSWDAWLFQFQNFMLNNWGTIRHEMPQHIRDGEINEAVNKATFLFIAQFAELGIRWSYRFGIPYTLYLMTGADWLKPEEEEEEKANMRVAAQFANNIPYVSQAMSVLNYGSTPVPVLSVWDSITDKVNYATKSKSLDKRNKHIASAIMVGVGSFAGIPGTLQADQIVRGVMDGKKSDKKPETKSNY